MHASRRTRAVAMENHAVNFNGYDGTIKRWHPKVARAAEQRIKEILADANIDSLGDFWAEFDASTSGPPTLIEKFNAKDVYRIIRFAARDWSTVDSSIEDAVNQLASVLVVYTRNVSLSRAFKSSGVAVGSATTERQRIDDDPNEHASIVIANDLSTDQFFSLVERIESELHLSGVGNVSGTGWGIGGWCIDLSAPAIEECIGVATEELESRLLQFEVNRY